MIFDVTMSPPAAAKLEFTSVETFHFAGITAGKPGERPLAFCPLDQSRDVHKVMARYHMDQPWGDSLGTPPRLMAAGDVVLKCGHRNVGYRHIGIRHGLEFKQLAEVTNYRWSQTNAIPFPAVFPCPKVWHFSKVMVPRLTLTFPPRKKRT